ncbi:MAG: membrane protein insertase YidC [Robiginitomaculum sp.]|nr:MAG: membrane protein insertase YidC [Robiginitomaculum sp.]
MDDQKRFLLAMVLSGAILVAYTLFFAKPQAELKKTEIAQKVQAEQIALIPKIELKDRTDLIRAVSTDTGRTRINIDTPSLSGSFSLTGSRFDDLRLKNYQQTIKKDSDTVIMFSPEGAEHAAYIFDNWAKAETGNGANNQWAHISGDTLTVETPVTISYTGEDFSVTRIVSIDKDYLITLKDTVTNTSSSDISLVRAGASRQHDLPEDLTNFFILQEGPIGVVGDKRVQMKYKKIAKKRNVSYQGNSGWVGLTDKYWLAATIAPQGQQMEANFGFKNLNGQDVYESRYTLEPTTLSPGVSIESIGYVFAGAKVHGILKAYQNEIGIAKIEYAIDWGALGILTRPFSWMLTKFGSMTGNFGIGILILTFLLKIILFPLNNKSYSSMAKMKALAPQIEKIKARYGDDRVKLQQETMALYKKNGANPAAGCLPMVPQMFIFFALYKSLFITLEMRHAPFFGWITDLSAKDPLSILNGFGLFPWDAVPFAALSFFAIGPLALMYGATMGMMQTLNTPPGDKMQARIFMLMPLIFMFILAPFATGLLVYWVWNNILTFIQQYIITRKFKVETPMDRFFGKIVGKGKKTADGE